MMFGKVFFKDGEAELAPQSIQIIEKNDTCLYQVNVSSKTSFLPEKSVVFQVPFENGKARWMAIEHHSQWWCRPTFGEKEEEIPDKTQFLLWQNTETKEWSCILPLCGDVFTSHLCVLEQKLSLVLFSLQSGLNVCNTPACVVAHGAQAKEVIHRCFTTACETLKIPLREDRTYPEIFEYLGWCSWDAMEIWVNEEGLLDKCKEFQEKKVPVRWGILDDMWADIAWAKELPPFTSHDISFGVMHASKMRNFSADPKRFPNGLKNCISAMKEFGLKVGIWHPVTGYWAGLEPNSPADQLLKPYTVTTENGAILPDYSDVKKAEGFFQTLHRYFAECGAEFIKVDNQSCLRDRYLGVAPTGVLAKNLHTALEESANQNFGGALINCMGMASESELHRSSAICRCSDDFQPENRAWFAKHLMQCAYNGLWQGQLHYNDWDMWWTDDSQAQKNSVLRAISGGPIYVSDKIGRTNPEYLQPLCFADGKICRCNGVAVPGDENLVENPITSEKVFFLVNTYQENQMIAAFNINEKNIKTVGKITPSQYGMNCDCVLYEYFSKQAICLKKDESYQFTLNDNDDYRLFTLLPKQKGRTVIGLVNKMISPAGIVASDSTSVTLYEAGELAWFENDKLYFANVSEKFYF